MSRECDVSVVTSESWCVKYRAIMTHSCVLYGQMPWRCRKHIMQKIHHDDWVSYVAQFRLTLVFCMGRCREDIAKTLRKNPSCVMCCAIMTHTCFLYGQMSWRPIWGSI